MLQKWYAVGSFCINNKFKLQRPCSSTCPSLYMPFSAMDQEVFLKFQRPIPHKHFKHILCPYSAYLYRSCLLIFYMHILRVSTNDQWLAIIVHTSDSLLYPSAMMKGDKWEGTNHISTDWLGESLTLYVPFFSGIMNICMHFVSFSRLKCCRSLILRHKI